MNLVHICQLTFLPHIHDVIYRYFQLICVRKWIWKINSQQFGIQKGKKYIIWVSFLIWREGERRRDSYYRRAVELSVWASAEFSAAGNRCFIQIKVIDLNKDIYSRISVKFYISNTSLSLKFLTFLFYFTFFHLETLLY